METRDELHAVEQQVIDKAANYTGQWAKQGHAYTADIDGVTFTIERTHLRISDIYISSRHEDTIRELWGRIGVECEQRREREKIDRLKAIADQVQP